MRAASAPFAEPQQGRLLNTIVNKPTAAFVGASWTALVAGASAYLVGLWNTDMQLNEKGYYFTLLMYGLFAAVSLQKTVRDRLENVPVTNLYAGLCWASMVIAVSLMAIGLFNAKLALAEKGFYAMAFLLALFATIAIQKNVRDAQGANRVM